ncbi:geranylgeranyl transferase type-1 subunit beta-like [Homarus americanus]|uniref:Geranylgeranyl transferase type-1 subunit beta n=1 Tax=Homarus americanus TaxID=6706 RepID=A0A8J5MM55_HOMAM|nr:geranylgeranyl transferase type-1 subunit beta-like [Homarus americanus]KAG7156320.1 Geranylgeranyl transferase type-1 subunit beta-like [Homarus americanus]
MSGAEDYQFLRTRHIKFLQRCLRVLPYSAVTFDTSRMTVLFFALSGLDLLDGLKEVEKTEMQHIINWIYSLQILPGDDKDQLANAGFRGGTSLASCRGHADSVSSISSFDCGHITMTYTALASLIILGDDLSRVDRKAVLAHVASLQCRDGSFFSTRGGSENDMRFMYCAATICYILQDFSAININTAVQYIINSMSYEGAMGQGIYLESHGGSSYCAIATLHLMGKLSSALSNIQKQRLVRWLVSRQDSGGLQGRPNKPPDTCYTFWIGASLKLLGGLDFLNLEALRQFVLSTQDPITGGLAKYPDSHPDGLHTYLGISGLALLGRDCLKPVDPALNISERALKHLHSLHKSSTQNSKSTKC